MKHIMLDIETLGRAPDGVIIQIGIAPFDIELRKVDPIKHSLGISAPLALKQGMTLNYDTIQWWMDVRRFDLLVDILVDGAGHELKNVLRGISEWFSWDEKEGIWSNAPLFDFVILRKAFTLCGLPCPWSYRQERCSRTLMQLAAMHWKQGRKPMKFKDVIPVRTGTHHAAWDDAFHQANVALTCAHILGLDR